MTDERPKRSSFFRRDDAESTDSGRSDAGSGSENKQSKPARRPRIESHDGKPRSSDHERSSFGDRERKPYDPDRKPYGERHSFGDRERKPYDPDRKPYGERHSFGDRKPFDPDRKPYGDRENKPYGERHSFGDRKPFDPDRKPYGDRERKPYGDRENKPYGERHSFGDRKPFDSDRKPYGDRERKPYDPDRKPYGDRENKPYGERRSFGDRERKPYDPDRKPYGDRERKPYGDRENKPYGERRSFGDRKPYDSDRKPYGDRENKPYGERQSFGDRERKPYNPDRKPYGDRENKPYGERRSFGDRKPYDPDRKPYGDRERKSSGKRKNDRDDKHGKVVRALQIDPNVPVRLNRFIAMSGVCSRREADELIQAGQVTVNGVVADQLGTKVMVSDEIKLNDQTLKGERKVYIIMNKPKGYVTTMDDPHADHTVMELLKDQCSERVYPVGRLDKSTTGVLLLTNDGDLAQELTHPSFEKRKIYHAFLDRSVTEEDLEKLTSGLMLEDGEIHADEVSYVDGKKNEVGIEIHSGRNHIVRRMFQHMGYEVEKLDRVFFAGFTKMGLRRGFWRYLTPREVATLKSGNYQ